MPRPRKTSTQPKRKVKKFVDKPKPVYPEYIQSFIEKVESSTPLKVKVDQYTVGSFYNVGVLKKQGKIYRCIWMVGHVDKVDYLNEFWKSESFKSIQ
jgi:hypothetical protein